MLGEGLGGPKDAFLMAAAEERGCELGNGNACFNAALSFVEGLGVQPTEARAVELFRRGCALAEPRSCAALDRLGVPREQPTE